jgi:hypothetical protein
MLALAQDIVVPSGQAASATGSKALLIEILPTLIAAVAVLGTFYGIQHTNRINAQLQQDRLEAEERVQNRSMLRAKGESLFILIDTFEKEFRQNAYLIAINIGEKGAKHALEGVDLKAAGTHIQQIEMYTLVYFPDASSILMELTSRWENRGELIMKLKKVTTPQQAEAMMIEVGMLSTYIAEYAEKLQKEITRILQQLHADIFTA